MEPTTRVSSTTDYDRFKTLSANRDISRGHVEALKRAFEETGNFTAVQPILVNDNFEIIDGQHRFQACKELGQPINFTVVPGLGVSDARQMNILHKRWHTSDYAKSYAESGNKSYQLYLQLLDEYGFNHSITMRYAIGSSTSKGVFKDFREGNFVIPDLNEAHRLLGQLAEIAEQVPIARTKAFALALLQTMRSPDYDQKRMVNKLSMALPHLEDLTLQEDNLRQIEGAYNWKQKGDRVRLF